MKYAQFLREKLPFSLEIELINGQPNIKKDAFFTRLVVRAPMSFHSNGFFKKV